MSRTLGAAIGAAGKRAHGSLGAKLGRVNDVHKAAVEGHYAAEAQQRAHEHTHSMLDKVHGYSGGGKVHLTVGADGAHSISYKKGGSGKAKSEEAKPDAKPEAKPDAKPDAKPEAKPRAPRKPIERGVSRPDGEFHPIVTRAQHDKAQALKAAITDKTSTKPAAKPAAKKPANPSTRKTKPTGDLTSKKFGTDR